MKKIYHVLTLTCLLVWEPELLKLAAQPGGRVTFQVFYDNLSPYGQWYQDPTYGYVWVPSVGAGFRPYYSNGYWVMTEYGNMWVSDYPWGWAPFHYGRWTYDSDLGWIWIPDTDWGPAWVSWRSNSDYYGWAPLGPGVTVSASFEHYSPPDDWWVFISPAYIYQPQWHQYYQGRNENNRIVRNTVIIRNTYNDNRRTYVGGPSVGEVQKVVHRDIPVYRVKDNTKPSSTAVENNQVSVYRPSVERSERVTPPNARKINRSLGKPQSEESRNQMSHGQQQNVTPGSSSARENASGQQPRTNDSKSNLQERKQDNSPKPNNQSSNARTSTTNTKPTSENKVPESRKAQEQTNVNSRPHEDKHTQERQPHKDINPNNDGQNVGPNKANNPSNRQPENRTPERRTDNAQQSNPPKQAQPKTQEIKQPPKPQTQTPSTRTNTRTTEQPKAQERREGEKNPAERR